MKGIAVATMLAAVAGMSTGMPSLAAPEGVIQQVRKKIRLDAKGRVRPFGYPRNSGWTNARYRRAALKRRNRARHRRACR